VIIILLYTARMGLRASLYCFSNKNMSLLVNSVLNKLTNIGLVFDYPEGPDYAISVHQV